MVFNSIPFLFFIVLFFLFWNFFKKTSNKRWVYLTFMSFLFYGWWDWRFLFLIIFSGLLDYSIGLMIPNSKRKKVLLFFSLVINLGALSVFKYSKFFASILHNFFLAFALDIDFIGLIPPFALILPVGISFFTFQSMSYTIDIYRGRLKPTKNIFHFFSYLSMFPQLVAGPIVRAKDFLIQLNKVPFSNSLQKWNGIKLFSYGLFQKTVLADNIGEMVNRAYSNNNTIEFGAFWWVILVGFAFQIYCDFSGYSMMARGIAKFMGYHFKMNFNHPYLANSFKQFWSRWHISLSTWFRDYVYIPLGGSKKGVFLGIWFMGITMTISGLWHGAGITFLLWGVCHALYLGIERLINVSKLENYFFKFVYQLLVFVLVVLAWNLFRAKSMGQALSVYVDLFSFSFKNYFYKFINPVLYLFIAISIEFIILLKSKNKKEFNQLQLLDVVLVPIAIVSSLFLRGPESEFIYFQF